MKRKYYHASRSVFKAGDIIAPNPFREHMQGRGIYATSSPCVHVTLWQFGEVSLGRVRYNVYQIRPLNPKAKIHYGIWDEWIIRGPVEVIRCLGEANKNGRVSSVVRCRHQHWTKHERLKTSKINTENKP